jgi:hypothetical protein
MGVTKCLTQTCTIPPLVTSNEALRWIVVSRFDHAARACSIAYVVAFDHIKIVAFALSPHIEGTLDPQILSSADSFKLFAEYISEGVQFTPATLQTFKLIVRFLEGARAPLSKLIAGCDYSEISFHFCKDCRIFHEGVKGNVVVKQKLENKNR